MNEKEEKKNRRTAVILSILIHGSLLCAFLFMIAWREPYPPLPEYGIELNFGLDNAGAGEVQPETTPEETTSEEDSAPEALPEEQNEIVQEEAPTEEVTEPIPQVVEELITTTQESPDVVEEQVDEQPEVQEIAVDPVEDISPQVIAETNEPEESPDDGADGSEGTSTNQQQANQGDHADEVGDQGDEQGTLDARALYGNAGGGDGSALEMTGWLWDFKPKPNDSSSESGKIVFEIKIDDQGEILSVGTLESNLSPSVEKLYEDEVRKLTFSKTSDNSIAAPVSTGKITFVIKSQ